MSRTRSKIGLKLYRFTQNPHYDELMTARTLERLRDIDRQYRDKGVEGLSLDADPLVPIGVEHDDAGKVTKNGYGVLHCLGARSVTPSGPPPFRRKPKRSPLPSAAPTASRCATSFGPAWAARPKTKPSI
ncbi:MAG: hypothetical protein R2748_25225 [Bryobacterales bacterium]